MEAGGTYELFTNLNKLSMAVSRDIALKRCKSIIIFLNKQNSHVKSHRILLSTVIQSATRAS